MFFFFKKLMDLELDEEISNRLSPYSSVRARAFIRYNEYADRSVRCEWVTSTSFWMLELIHVEP